MTDTLARPVQRITPDRLLTYAARLWFCIAAIGQWAFVLYVALYYLPLFTSAGLEGLNQTTLPNGFNENDMLGNIAIAFHVVIAIVIIGGGPLQLVPAIRNRYPAFHRYLGRTWVLMSVLTSIAGLYVVWTHGVPGGMTGHIAITLDAVLIILFSAIAVNHARKRRFADHRRWMLRTFMVVNAVWFFRIGLMAWFMLTGGIGIDSETFTGPFISFIYFGQMFVPLLILEVYLRAGESRKPAPKLAAAGLVLASALFTGLGVFAASAGMWLPRLV